jgi:hypothetical protein
VLSNRFYIFVSARFHVFSYSDFGVGENNNDTKFSVYSFQFGTMDKFCRCSLFCLLLLSVCVCACVYYCISNYFSSLIYCLNLPIVKTFAYAFPLSLSLLSATVCAWACFFFLIEKRKEQWHIFYLLSKRKYHKPPNNILREQSRSIIMYIKDW